MPKIEIDEQRCKGCGLCTVICPQKIIVLSDSINVFGYHPAAAPDQARCTGCAMCAEICPDVDIFVLY
jgi:2-oxoglutarate ferredoxin oxidoreductase subunit delta